MKSNLCLLLLLCLLCIKQGQAQSEVFVYRYEFGLLRYQMRSFDVDTLRKPKGYAFGENNGFEIAINTAGRINTKNLVGIEYSYFNIKKVAGFTISFNYEYLLFKTRLSPSVGSKLGYSYVKNINNYHSLVGEVNFGLNYRLKNMNSFYLRTGYVSNQKSLFVPIRFGFELVFGDSDDPNRKKEKEKRYLETYNRGF